MRLVERYIEGGRVVVDPPMFDKDDRPIVAEQLARLALLTPLKGTELDAAVQFANVAAAAEYPQGLAGRQLAKGLAEYRAGSFIGAVDWMKKAIRTSAQKSLPGWTHERERNREATARSVRAMAYHELKRTAEANEDLAKGREIILTQLPAAGSGDIGREWPDCINALLLFKEAEGLLKIATRGQ